MASLADRIANLSPEKRALLEQELRGARARPSVPPIPRYDDAAAVPSLSQERLWLLEQIDGPSPVYNVPLALELSGPLDLAAVKAALTAVVARHEPLRTRYVPRGGQLAIEVLTDIDLPLEVRDLTGLPQSERDQGLAEALEAEARRVFLLDGGVLLRAVVFRAGPDHHVLLLTVHHIAIDGWSVSVLLREFEAVYNAHLAGVAPQLPALPIRYTDYARWQRERMTGDNLDRLRAHWVERLHGSPLVLDLPTDRPRPSIRTIEGGVRHNTLSPELMARLRAFCRAEQATPYMVLMTAIYVVLFRWCRTTDILTGLPIAGRIRTETEGLIGFFVNTLVLRGDVSGDPTFREMLGRVREAAWDAYAHEELPFEKLVTALNPPREVNRSPVFQVMVTLQKTPAHTMQLQHLTSTVRELHTGTAKFDIDIDVREVGDRVEATLEYSAALFDAGTIDRFWSYVTTVMAGGIATPDQSIHTLPMLSEAQRRQVLVDWNQTDAAYPREVSPAALVEQQVARTPEAVAVVAGETSLTYRELSERARRLAARLRAHGAGPDVLVGVCLDRSADLVVALLAVSWAGAGYLPLDPALPAERLRFIVEDSGARSIIADRSTVSILRRFTGTNLMMLDAPDESDRPLVEPAAVGPDHLAYVIYTSGSTGRPKGVEIPRGAFTNFLWAMQSVVAMSNTDRLLAVTTISFDIAGLEIWLPLVTGAQIVLAGREATGDASAIEALLAGHDITFFQATPVTWRLLLAVGWAGKKTLRALCGGEALPPDLARALRPRVGRLWNVYGPTETTVWSTCARVEDPNAPILIGRPLANTRCYVLDAERRPVPVGTVGELYIGGDGLARGYLNRPDLTAEKFVRDPFDPRPQARMYRTGDLARYHPDGQLECLGRTDHQIKIRGFRIEPGEIEARLKQQAAVQDAVVVAWDEGGRDKQLVAYLVARPASKPDAAKLREALRTELPDYMVPAFFVTLDTFPLTPSGKIDRRGLPSPQQRAARDGVDYRAPRNPIEFALEGIWAEVLGLPRVGIDANFFDLGGDSLLSVALMSRVLAMFPGIRPALSQLLHAPTPAQFAKLVGRDGVPPEMMVRLKDGTADRLPFFCIPGGGGNILSLRPLALAMPDDLPFYCLQAKGLDGSAPFDTVEDTARRCVEEIRSVQPSGPYRLGGGCYGGLVAYETACLLEAAGERVDVLALIDAINPAYGRSLGVFTRARAVVRYYSDRLREKSDGRRSWAWRGFRKRFDRALHQLPGIGRHASSRSESDEGDLPFVEGDTELTEILVRVRNASDEATRKFAPRTYRGAALVIKAATQEPDIYSDPSMGWGRVVRGPLTVVEVPGDHESSFLEPHVRAVALAISAVLH